MSDRRTQEGPPRRPTVGVDPFDTTSEPADERVRVDPYEATGELAPTPDDEVTDLDVRIPPEFSETATADTVAASVTPDGDEADVELGGASAGACPRCRLVGDPAARYCVRCGANMRVPPDDVDSRASTDPAPPSSRAPLLPFTPPAAPCSGSGRCPGCEAAITDDGPTCAACGFGLGDPVVLVAISPDGSQGERLAPIRGVATLGRGEADRAFPDDAYLSPVHARLTVTDRGVQVEDLESLNGTFVRLRRPAPLGPGDTFVVGRQLLRMEAVGRAHVSTAGKDGTRLLGSPPPEGDFVLVQLSASGRVQDRYHLLATGAVLGRDHGEVRFPNDRYVSGRHAKIALSRGRATLTDLGSSNGTWLRVRRPASLAEGDEIYLGSQVFRLVAA